MRIIVLAAVVLIVLGSFLLLRAIYTHYLKAAKWTLNERTATSGRYFVELVNPRERTPLIIKSLDPQADDFDYAIEEARSTAEIKAVAMNARSKLRK